MIEEEGAKKSCERRKGKERRREKGRLEKERRK